MLKNLFKFESIRGRHKGGGSPCGFQDNGVQVIRGLSNLYAPEEDNYVAPTRDAADVLLEMGKLTEEQVAKVRQTQEKRIGSDAAQVIKEFGFGGEAEILMARASLYGFEFRKIEPDEVDEGAFAKVDFGYIKNNHIMPVGFEGENLVVATSQPADVFVIDDVKRQTGMNVDVVVCVEEDIQRVCQALDRSKPGFNIEEVVKDLAGGEVEVVQHVEQEVEDLEKIAGESPIIMFVNYLISNAMHEGASDIHIEAKEGDSRVRYRVDGILFDSTHIPSKMHSAVVSRLKIMSNLDISERRLPQDGRIAAIVGGRSIDMRVSTLPTSHGEKVVIRILDGRSILLGLNELGMAPEVLDVFYREVHRPHGIILVTGPTGSGKTTTLYSALNQMDGNKLNISTVEDPVEYQLGFCNQVQISEKTGLTFAASLRSLLRQDPDVIMIGEIRDKETARIAVQAALTGHLVLSTLHTNDAPSSISRLVDIGVEPYLIAASLNSILAQRLVRKICSQCKKPFDVPGNMQEAIKKAGVDSAKVYHGGGCDHCRESGYSGRVGIYELLVVNDVFRETIIGDSSINNMRRVFGESGGKTLYDDGMRKVKDGVTTIEEVLRVTEIHNAS